MLVRIIDKVLIGLIAQHQQVPVLSESGHVLKFFACVHSTSGILRVVEDQQLGPGCGALLQSLVRKVVLLLCAERDRDRRGLCQLNLLPEAAPDRLHQ